MSSQATTTSAATTTVSTPTPKTKEETPEIFTNTFLQYLNNEDMSDIQIVVEDDPKPIFAHKFILAAKSEYFKNLLFGNFFESGAKTVKINGVSRNIMLKVLEFIYSGRVRELDEESIILLCRAANMFVLQPLQQLCVEYLQQKIDQLNHADLLLNAVKHNVRPLMDLVLQSSAEAVLNDEKVLSELTEEVMRYIVSSDEVSMEEKEVFECLMKWGRTQAQKITKSAPQSTSPSSDSTPTAVDETVLTVIKPLLPLIRWAEIDSSYIAQKVEPLKIVESSIILATYRYQLTGIKDEQILSLGVNPYKTRDAGGGKPFIYVSDFDTNGVLYYLGCLRPNDFKTKQEYQNPHTTKMVEVIASSVKYGCKVEDFITREKVNNMTKNEGDSWFGVDLMYFSLKPTNYTIRYGGSGGDSCMRNWVFEASNNKKEWTVIKKHVDDKSLDGGWATFTFSVDKPKQFYRYFRVKMTGKNKNNTDFLLNSGFELYGYLKKNPTVLNSAMLTSTSS